jgi:hypothetical protein
LLKKQIDVPQSPAINNCFIHRGDGKMTIAACYLSSEGVVFGADSTSTMFVPGFDHRASGSEHHYNFAQKIFQIGENSTLAMTMWGLGSLPKISYRTLIAQFADLLVGQGAQSMADVATRWSRFFWSFYSTELSRVIARAQALHSQTNRTTEEEREFLNLLQTFSGGFCLGGYLMNDRTPSAHEILFNPTLTEAKVPPPLQIGRTKFWGCPNLVNRLLFGFDETVFSMIIQSGKWTGTDQDLFDVISPCCLGQPFDLPIREAIDWVYASIYTTIKTMKFSHMAPVCGGPVELAVITTDRRFRWVRHKGFDSAINEGRLHDVSRDHG